MANGVAVTTAPGAVRADVKAEVSGAGRITHVSVTNPGTHLAFSVHLKVVDAKGEEILPVLWQDNYFALMPGERREISATVDPIETPSVPAKVELDGWNIEPASLKVK